MSNLSPNQFRVAHWAREAWAPEPEFVRHTTVEGKMTPDVEHAYEKGQCHALAIAVHHKEGHPIGAVYDSGDKSNEAMHFFNYDKNNPSMGFDIRGHQPLDTLVSRFNNQTSSGADAYHRSSSVEEIRGIVKNAKGGWMKPNIPAAMTLVSKVVKGARR